MKHVYISSKGLLSLWIISFLFSNLPLKSQTVEFFDGFESGTANWVLTGNWGVSTNSFAGIYGLTESPNGNYWNMESSSATMLNGVDLSLATDAYVEFAANYNLEFSFDYLYVEASYNNGQNWLPVTSFTGDSLWWRYSFSIGGFVGHTNVKVRFRFLSDQALNYNGFSFDNFQIVSYMEDVTPPMILHDGPQHYEGELDTFYVQASIIDISGVASATLHYWVDSLFQGVIPGNNYAGTNWMFTIPPVSPGAWVDYYVIATDLATNPNTDTTQLYQYIAGNTIKYDNAVVDYVQIVGQFQSISGVAVKMDLNGLTTVVSGLIRTYTDPFIINGPIQFHIWDNNNGVPGNDLVTPFLFIPEANPSAPHRMTRIDLRPYIDSLAGLSGSVFVGYTSPGSTHYTPITSPGSGGHSYYFNGVAWAQGQADLHFRVVTTAISGAPTANFSFNAQNDPQVAFTDLTTGNPVNWIWDFDNTFILSQIQNPTYVFEENGTYHVCLTAINAISSSTHCEFVEITNCLPPVANFSFISDYSPEILFQDSSINFPTSWHWDFDDNGNTWGYLNPIYTFTHNDTFNVCLIVANNYGSDTLCKPIIINDYTAPFASFSYSSQNSPYIQFFDESSGQVVNSPDTWVWNFGDGSLFSSEQNPLHLFPDNGVYQVCLTASNAYGSSNWCMQVVIDSYVAPTAGFSWEAPISPTYNFIDQSSDSIHNQTTSWYWTFGDGASSTLQNPQHNYAQNGTYTICLIATNVYGSDTLCHDLFVNLYQVPLAAFTFSTNYSPLIFFVDYSTGFPTQWEWNFDDNSSVSVNQNPGHTYLTNGPFNVCLIVSNYLGSDTICQPISLTYYTAPVSNFTYQKYENGLVEFQDLSTMNPTQWDWTFGDGNAVSTIQHPEYTYPTPGTYQVCLTATNGIGQGNSLCKEITFTLSDPINQTEEVFSVYPNPVSDWCVLRSPIGLSVESLTVFDESGRQVKVEYSTDKNEFIHLSLGHLAAGVYWVDAKTEDRNYQIKLIKVQ
jgi:PKD repeat protein